MAGYKRLGDLLVAAGAITEEQLQRALTLQKGSGKRLGTVLIEQNIITEFDLIDALQMQLGIDYIDLTKYQIPMEMARVIPKNIARKNSVVPVKVVRDELYLAMSDPMNFYALEEVRKAVHKKVVPMIATQRAVDYAITILYGNEGAAQAIEEMKRENADSDDNLTTGNAFVSNQVGEDGTQRAPTIRLVNSIIERAINERASDIHVEILETEMRVRMRVDGMMRNILTVPKNLQNSVISRIKIMSGMDISERRVPQDGRFNVTIQNKDIDMRVSTLPTIYGEKIVMRLLDKSEGRLTKEGIGLAGADLDKFNRLMTTHSGVVLIVGPTGSGKSSTMYTMIGELNTDDVNLVTLEDPVEYNIAGVNQVQINEKTGMTFANGLRAILRQDPDIIAVGEIRDGETADIAMRAAITGHTVLSTIHTNDAISTIERLQDIGVEPYLTASALKGVISQRLVRRICPHCKQEYTPTADELDGLGIEDVTGIKFYKGAGCPNCFDTGYRGRIGVFEILTVDRGIRQCIFEGKGRKDIEDSIAKNKDNFVTLKENAIRLVEEGVTTISEVYRVIAEQV